VRLRARISPAGTVEEVGLEQSSGYPLLDRAALAGVRRWRFSPASRNGVPVSCEVSIPVAFRLEEGR
jgi:protein TonB